MATFKNSFTVKSQTATTTSTDSWRVVLMSEDRAARVIFTVSYWEIGRGTMSVTLETRVDGQFEEVWRWSHYGQATPIDGMAVSAAQILKDYAA